MYSKTCILVHAQLVMCVYSVDELLKLRKQSIPVTCVVNPCCVDTTPHCLEGQPVS